MPDLAVYDDHGIYVCTQCGTFTLPGSSDPRWDHLLDHHLAELRKCDHVDDVTVLKAL